MPEMTPSTPLARLTDVERKLVEAAWENRQIGAPTCEVCKQPDTFSLGDIVISPLGLGRGEEGAFVKVLGRSRVMPSIAMMCSNCGNTKLINLVVLGVVPEAKPEPEPSEGGKNV